MANRIKVTTFVFTILKFKVWTDVDTDEEINIKGRDDVTLHCTELGNYEKLRCDNGLCWCVEERYIISHLD